MTWQKWLLLLTGLVLISCGVLMLIGTFIVAVQGTTP